MKKVIMLGLAIILIVIALSSLGHMIGMAISLALVYFSLKQFLKSSSFFAKLLWAIIGICALFAVLASLPALAGVLAIYILYVGYKHWKKCQSNEKSSSSPFDSFDQQWDEINKNYR